MMPQRNLVFMPWQNLAQHGKKPAKRKGIKKSTTKVMTELHDTVSAVASVSSLPSAPTIQRQGDNSSTAAGVWQELCLSTFMA